MTFPPGPQGFDPRETRTWARARNKGAGAYVLYEWLRRPFELLDECAARYGETFSIRFPGTPTFVVFSNPDAVKEIFADGGEDMHGGKINILLRPFLGDHSVLMLDARRQGAHASSPHSPSAVPRRADAGVRQADARRHRRRSRFMA